MSTPKDTKGIIDSSGETAGQKRNPDQPICAFSRLTPEKIKLVEAAATAR